MLKYYMLEYVKILYVVKYYMDFCQSTSIPLITFWDKH